MTGATRPDIPAVPAGCPASTPADGIMVSCELAADHERHRGTYVHEFAGVRADVEVSWLTGEPADAVADAAAPGVTSPAPAPARPPATATAPSAPVSEAAVQAALDSVAPFWKEAHAILQAYPSAALARAMLEGAASLIRADERERGAEDRTACEAQITGLESHLDTLAKEHARHALAVSAHKGRADQQESRAVRAEKMLARFARQAEEYDALAAQAAQGYRNADLVTELRRRIDVLERSQGRAVAAERARIRRGILGIETVLERPETGESVVAVETMALEALIGPEADSAITGTGEEPS